MSPSAVPNVARLGKRNAPEVVVAMATVHHAKCSLQRALSVAKTLKYPLNRAAIDLFIVAIATVKLNPVDKAGLPLRDMRRQG